jgi:hypothetical protein
MARAIIGIFPSTPLGLLVAESGLTPVIRLLNYRQTRNTPWLYQHLQHSAASEEIIDGKLWLQRPYERQITSKQCKFDCRSPGRAMVRAIIRWSYQIALSGSTLTIIRIPGHSNLNLLGLYSTKLFYPPSLLTLRCRGEWTS